MSLELRIGIQVNGAAEIVDPGTTPADLLSRLGLEGSGIAVAVNDIVVRQNELGTLVLSDGDRVEIIRAVGGG
ncbi:MAG: sulfur carrier protein ThiS [Candidatus Eisenbacteria bacterium]|nr:sulfur carrier protein ThiS [Candidatus Eisenbacteria bacterium]